MITGAQIREARRLLGWGPAELAQRTKLDIRTIERVLADEGEAQLTIANENALRQALTRAGVEFVEGNGEGPGVRLRKERSDE